jgi:hypothetical protein
MAQIATGVLVAALVGGSAPWWWNDVKSRFSSKSAPITEEHAPPPKPTAPAENYSQADYDAVQAIYEKRKTARSCEDAKQLVSRIREYFGNQHLVPPKLIDTVRYPSPVPKPTIGDFARDRVARIRDARPACFP